MSKLNKICLRDSLSLVGRRIADHNCDRDGGPIQCTLTENNFSADPITFPYCDWVGPNWMFLLNSARTLGRGQRRTLLQGVCLDGLWTGFDGVALAVRKSAARERVRVDRVPRSRGNAHRVS